MLEFVYKMAARIDQRCLDESFDFVSRTFSLPEGLKSQQSAALKQFVEGHDLTLKRGSTFSVTIPHHLGKHVIHLYLIG